MNYHLGNLFKLIINHFRPMFHFYPPLALSWRRSLSYRNESIHLLCKSMDWFLYDRDLRHERVKGTIWTFSNIVHERVKSNFFADFLQNSYLKIHKKTLVDESFLGEVKACNFTEKDLVMGDFSWKIGLILRALLGDCFYYQIFWLCCYLPIAG